MAKLLSESKFQWRLGAAMFAIVQIATSFVTKYARLLMPNNEATFEKMKSFHPKLLTLLLNAHCVFQFKSV